MITQEMIEAALQADMKKRIWLQARSTSYAPADKSKMQMGAAIKAVYPLILEEAAKEAETNLLLLPIHPEETKHAYGIRIVKAVATAIRNLKDKTDE